MSGGVKEVSAEYRSGVQVDDCPVGYKRTEVGVIPEDWELTKIDDVVKRGWLDKPLDGNHGDIHPKSGDFVNSGIPFVMANNLKNGKVDIANCSFIRKEQADSLQKGFSKAGDVLLTHKATIGNTAVVSELPCEYIMLTPQVTYYRVLNNDVLNNYYLRHYMDGNVFQTILETNSGGGTRSYIGITAQRQLPIVIPPFNEQIAIAKALSDVDALITSLEKLITKKRAIKTAAMQQLLTGKKRLPPFDKTHTGYKQTELGEIPEDWEVKLFGDCVKSFQLGGNYKNNDVDSGCPLMKMGNIARGYISLKKIEYIPKGQSISEKDRCNYDDIYFNTRNTLELVGKVSIWSDELTKAYFNSNLMRITFKDKFVASNKYMNYLMNTKYFIDSLADIAIGTTSVAAIYTRDLIGLKMILPSPDEQVAIAVVLSDMDKDIKVLEQRLTKTNQLKQGMMQELLTGRTRLI